MTSASMISGQQLISRQGRLRGDLGMMFSQNRYPLFRIMRSHGKAMFRAEPCTPGQARKTATIAILLP
jgi:hypothetical protein